MFAIRVLTQSILALLIVLYVTLFSVMSILQYQNLHRLTRDLGLYQQLLWNALQGRFFAGTMVEALMGSPNALADHFSPGLLVLLPLFALWPDPRLLLVVQSLAYALAAIPIYLFGRDRLAPGWLALVVAGAYLLQPALQYATLFEFHEISLAVPLIALAIWLVHRHPQQVPLLMVVVLLALTMKEDVSLTVIALGVYVVARLRRWRLGLVFVVLGLAWAVAVVGFVMPALNTHDYSFTYVRQYAGLGNTPGEILWTTLTHPQEVVQRLLTPAKLGFLRDLLLPFGFLPLLGLPVFLLGAPTLGYLMLSDDPTFATIQYHHPVLVEPILALAVVDGLARLSRFRRYCPSAAVVRSLRIVLPLWLVATGAGALLAGQGPIPGRPAWSHFRIDERSAQTTRFLQQIPPTAAVSASGNLIAPLANRAWIKEFPTFDGADHVVLDYGTRDASDAGQVGPGWWNAQRAIWRDDRWQLQDARDRLVLLKREKLPPPQPPIRRRLGLAYGEQFELTGYQVPVGRSVPPGGEVPLTLYWRGLRAMATSYVISVQLVDGDNRRLWQQDAPAWGGAYPTTEWTPGRLFRDVRHVKVPPDLLPGVYRLLVAAYASGESRTLPIENGGPLPYRGWALLGPISVAPAHETMAWPGDWRPIGLGFGGNRITLRRAWLDRLKSRPGQWLNLATEWQAHRPLGENYTLFVHLRDEQFRIWGQQDEQPGWGYRATTTWRPGEPVEEVTAFRVRPETPPGRYLVDVGFYNLETHQRLPIGPDGAGVTQATVAEVRIGD